MPATIRRLGRSWAATASIIAPLVGRRDQVFRNRGDGSSGRTKYSIREPMRRRIWLVRMPFASARVGKQIIGALGDGGSKSAVKTTFGIARRARSCQIQLTRKRQ